MKKKEKEKKKSLSPSTGLSQRYFSVSVQPTIVFELLFRKGVQYLSYPIVKGPPNLPSASGRPRIQVFFFSTNLENNQRT